MDVDRATDGAGADAARDAPGRDGFDDVFGSAIARAVRRAVDDLGRTAVEDLPDLVDGKAFDGDGDGDGAAVDGGRPEPRWVHALASAERAPTPGDAPPLPADGTTDPYELLGVDRRAEWSAITAAYKQRARAWHPDGAPDDEQGRRHELLRDLNAAYAELRVRRGR